MDVNHEHLRPFCSETSRLTRHYSCYYLHSSAPWIRDRFYIIRVHQLDMRINLKLRVEHVMIYQYKFIQGYNLYCAFVCKLQKSSDNLRSSLSN